MFIKKYLTHDTRLERDLHKLFIVDIRETQINIQSTILKYSVRITYVKVTIKKLICWRSYSPF